MGEGHAQRDESRIAGTAKMPAYSAMDHNQRPELVPRADLGGDVCYSSEALEFLGEYVRHEKRRRQRKSLVESSAEEPVRVILNIPWQHSGTLKRFRLRSGAVESRGKR
jgi:hypothetical protein